MKIIVKTEHLAVLVFNCSNQVQRNANRRERLLYDIRSHNIDKLRHANALYNWSPLLECFIFSCYNYTRLLAVSQFFVSTCIPSKPVTQWIRDLNTLNGFVI